MFIRLSDQFVYIRVCVIICRRSRWHWLCVWLTSPRSEVTDSTWKRHSSSWKASTTPVRRRRRTKIIRRRCSSNRSKVGSLFFFLFHLPLAEIIFTTKDVWLSISILFLFVCVDSWTGGQRRKENWERGMKKWSSSGTCSIPVTLRYGEEHACNHTYCLSCVCKSLWSRPLSGRSTGAEWVSWRSAVWVWEVRGGEEGHPLWRELNVVSDDSKSWDTDLRTLPWNRHFPEFVSENGYSRMFWISYQWHQCRACTWLWLFVLQRHPDGVASIAFKEPEQADACIASFNGRWFGGKQLSAELWDGTTDYQVR